MGGIRLDAEMLEHARVVRVGSTEIPLISAEDQLLIDACGAKPENPGHWFAALSVIAAGDIDWVYLSERARLAPRRLLALLSYAQSDDLLVPDAVLKNIFDRIYGEAIPPIGAALSSSRR